MGLGKSYPLYISDFPSMKWGMMRVKSASVIFLSGLNAVTHIGYLVIARVTQSVSRSQNLIFGSARSVLPGLWHAAGRLLEQLPQKVCWAVHLECDLLLSDCHITVLDSFRAPSPSVFIKTLERRRYDIYILQIKKLRLRDVHAVSGWRLQPGLPDNTQPLSLLT